MPQEPLPPAWPGAGAVEDVLRVVPGVAHVEVADDPAGGPGQVRVTLAPYADEIGVARAVHKVLRLQFGVGLDPRRIEVLEEQVVEVPEPRLHVVAGTGHPDQDSELDDAVGARLAGLGRPGTERFDTDVLASAVRHPAGSGATPSLDSAVQGGHEPVARRRPPEPRLSLSRLLLSADDSGVTATVSLSHHGVEHTGTAEGPASGTAVHRTVAEATLRAIASAAEDVRLDVESVAITPVGAERVVVVQVVMATASGGDRLTGAAEVRDDVRQAVVKATLDAVNRRLAPTLDP